jgi:hypothetical protein
VSVSDPGSDVVGEDVPLNESDCDEPVDEDAPEDEGEGEGEGEDSGKKLLRILTTSSNTSSSHKLSLNPSEASMRISSCSMGSVNVRAWVEGLDGESEPNCTGVLNCEGLISGYFHFHSGGTYAPPHFFAPPYYVFSSHQHTHTIT